MTVPTDPPKGSSVGVATPTPSCIAAAAPPERPWIRPAAIFAILWIVYLSNGGFLPSGDAVPNLYLPVQLLSGKGFSFAPHDVPFMFTWQLSQGTSVKIVDVDSWQETIAGRKASDLQSEGVLVVSKPRYFLAEGVRQGRYVNIYGPGAGITALPYFAVLSLFKKDWKANSGILGQEGRIFAAALVAGSAVFVYLALLCHLRREAAMGLSLLYGLGTCVWAEPTQALWQQTPTLFFVSMGALFLSRIDQGRKFALACGFAFGTAVLCRPTVGILLAATSVYLLLKARKSLSSYLAGALPALLMLAWYNATYLGSPFMFGQMKSGDTLSATAGTLGGALQAPHLETFAGLLVSPSRGLFVFSPFFLFSVWGAVEAWRHQGFGVQRVLGVTVAGFVVLAACWFQWYGGSCFGYRILVEGSPLLVLLLVPVAHRVLASKTWRGLFVLCAVWSVIVQTLGTFAYDPIGWNERVGYELILRNRSEPLLVVDKEEVLRAGQSGEAISGRKVRMNVSNPQYARRLWSVGDSQIAFFFGPNVFAESRDVRQSYIRRAYKESSDR